MSERWDAVTVEVTRNRLEAIVEEMGLTMLKTAHSPIFYESKDYSVALFTPNAELLAMGQYIPHHQGGMQAALSAVLELFDTDDIGDGDAFLINDPYLGGTHTPDFNLLAPVFVDGGVAAFAGCAAHQIDCGGMTPGGYAPLAETIHQEGFRFPGIKLVEGGRLRKDMMRLILRNVRLPEQQRGDILGQLAALRVAQSRLPVVVGQLGTAGFRALCAELLELTERRVRAEIEAIPDGRYEVTDHLDHDGHTDRVYELHLAMTVMGSEVVLDFTGTDEQAPGFVNASYWNTRASAFASFMLFLDPTIPRNHGFFRPLGVEVPRGTLLNPLYPAPVGGSTTEAGGRVYDLVLRALSKANPERGIGTWSMMWMALFLSGTDPRTGASFIHCVLDGVAPGGGARAEGDGWNASSIAASNCLIPNVEIEEDAYPVRYVRRELRPDTGGAGRYRGGLALESELLVEAECEATVFGSRRVHPPKGIFGGGSGAPSDVRLRRREGGDEQLPQKAMGVRVRAGDRIVLRACGGGGYGPSEERDPAAVERDIAEGFVTRKGVT